jgi:hypothetical protein
MLTLVEEFLLLTLRDEGGTFVPLPRYIADPCFAGAALMELALHNRVDSDLEGLCLVDPTPTGDPALDLVLERCGTPEFNSKHARVIGQLAPYGTQIRDLALTSLCEAGVLSASNDTYLWVFHTRRYPLLDGREIREAKIRLLGILLRDDIPDARDACLLGLADVSGLLEQIVPPSELPRAQARMAQLAYLDLIGRSLREYLTVLKTNIDLALLQAMAHS